VDVLNTKEVKLYIFIEVFILITFPSCTVCNGIYLGSKGKIVSVALRCSRTYASVNNICYNVHCVTQYYSIIIDTVTDKM